MAASMNLIVKRCFPKADRVIDRFHVQQLAMEAVQELDKENEQIAQAKKFELPYYSELLPNGDSPKQLLARNRFLLFKHKDTWPATQKQRAQLMFERYPRIKQVYDPSQKLGAILTPTIMHTSSKNTDRIS